MKFPGGGFEWFGHAPANVTLTAYGLMEFQDMQEVHHVDPQLIARTRNWLLRQREANGSWLAERGMINDGLAGNIQQGRMLDLATTAYVAGALFADSSNQQEAEKTLNYLLSVDPAEIDNVYTLALVTHAIQTINDEHSDLDEYYELLLKQKKVNREKSHLWWEQPQQARTSFYGSGISGDIETTALITLVLIAGKESNQSVTQALNWLSANRDSGGNWHSTQATILTLKALIAGTGMIQSENKNKVIEILKNDEVIRQITITPDQSDVLKQFDFTAEFQEQEATLSVRQISGTAATCRIVSWYHVDATEREKREPLSIQLTYSDEQLSLNDHLIATVRVQNVTDEIAPMVMLELPIPAGFLIERAELDELISPPLRAAQQQPNRIEKYEITERHALIYLRSLHPNEPLTLRYRLRATMPVKVQIDPAQAYHYYDPAQRGSSSAAEVEVQQ